MKFNRVYEHDLPLSNQFLRLLILGPVRKLEIGKNKRILHFEMRTVFLKNEKSEGEYKNKC